MDLSIIILSYNTKDITDKCLEKLKFSVIRCQAEFKNKIEVIVLDNASSDGSVGMIQKKHHWVKLIVSPVNTGFSKGNNIAVKKASYGLILFLNSDVFVSEDTLTKTIAYFKNHPGCDVLGAKLVYEDNRLQPSAGFLPTPVNAIFWILGIAYLPLIGKLTAPFHPRFKSFFATEHEVGWTTGAFFVIKKNVFEKVKGFDEDIFMYMDEVDLCKRLQLANFKVYYTPSIKAIHLHRASSKSNPEKVFTRELAGIRYYFKKYYPNQYPIIRLFLFLGVMLRIIAFSLLGKTASAKAYMAGLRVI